MEGRSSVIASMVGLLRLMYARAVVAPNLHSSPLKCAQALTAI
jgi:hypothetical protein